MVCALFLILVPPLAATLLYSLATQWSATLLPDGLTLKWYLTPWSDQRFLLAFARSLLVCFGALAFSVADPAADVRHPLPLPAPDGVMNVLILCPSRAAIVSSVGLLQLYASGPLEMIGTPWVLVGCYFTIALPFMYRAITNNLQAINLVRPDGRRPLLGAAPEGGAAGRAAEPAQGRDGGPAAVVPSSSANSSSPTCWSVPTRPCRCSSTTCATAAATTPAQWWSPTSCSSWS